MLNRLSHPGGPIPDSSKMNPETLGLTQPTAKELGLRKENRKWDQFPGMKNGGLGRALPHHMPKGGWEDHERAQSADKGEQSGLWAAAQPQAQSGSGSPADSLISVG